MNYKRATSSAMEVGTKDLCNFARIWGVLRAECEVLDNMVARPFMVSVAPASIIALSPFFQLMPIPALIFLPKTCREVRLKSAVAWCIVRMTAYVFQKCLKTMRYMLKLSALGHSPLIFNIGLPYFLLFVAINFCRS